MWSGQQLGIDITGIGHCFLENDGVFMIDVTIVGSYCWISTAPNTDSKILGVAHKEDTLPYGDQVYKGGWVLV